MKLSDDATSAVLAACHAVLTYEGERALAEREQALLETLQKLIAARADREHRPASDLAKLGEALADAGDRQQLMALLLTCAVFDGELDGRRLAIVKRIGADLDSEPRELDALVTLARKQSLSARICLLRRVTRDLYHKSLWSMLGAVLGSLIREDGPLLDRYRKLETLPAGTFGRALFAFYEENLFRLPGERGPMPGHLVAAHDARHVLTGWDGGVVGEVALAGFESGASPHARVAYLMSVLLHLHAGIQSLEPYIPTRNAPVDVALVAREMARGAAASPEIIAADWDFWRYAERPIAEVRAALGVAPGGRPDGVRWCGQGGLQRSALPIDKVTVLPETDTRVLALDVSGKLSANDIAAVSDLLDRRSWGGRKIDLLLQLSDGGGYASAGAFWSDMKLALSHRHAFNRIAIVTNSRWQSFVANLDRPFARMFGASERVFTQAARDEALAFLATDA